MLIGVAMQEIEQFVAGFIARYCQPSHQGIGGHAVNGEHIDIDTSQIVAVRTLNQGGAAVDNLAEATWIGGRCLDAKGFERLGQPLMGVHHETVVVGTRHADVHIVVPRDETFVTDGAQHRARPTVVSDVVRLTDSVYRQKYLQNMLVECIYIV